MKLIDISTIKEFEELKKGDFIMVNWRDDYVKNHPKAKEVMLYKIFENKLSSNEIICRFKDNHYFNYKMYLRGESFAKNVQRVIYTMDDVFREKEATNGKN